MSAPTPTNDLLDLKMMPAWVNEPVRPNEFADYQGEDAQQFERRSSGPRRERDSRPRGARPTGQRDRGPRPDRGRPERPTEDRRPREVEAPRPEVAVRFLPNPAAFESVLAQIKSNAVTYSVFALARMFLDKPERYVVQLTSPAETPLHQLGENGVVAADRRLLEGSAFANAKDDFYTVEVTQSEPLKGNFSNVARERSSGTLLGPTNHHAYQPRLRGLYEERFSRRMSFSDFQRQIEIVSDPAVVEEWKEQARSVTTYTAKDQDPPLAFSSVAEAERHFRQAHLPSLLRASNDLTVSGVASRRLPDRALGRVIEDAWSSEMRSPSKMMAELAGGLKGAGLNIFRHRKGMLFVSPMRLRSFGHEPTSVSPSINAILEKLAKGQGMNRKKLADELIAGLTEPAEIDKVKLSLASDLRWLVSEGYVIEFNDGLLDLPRTKVAPAPAAKEQPTENASAPNEPDEATAPVGEIAPALEPEIPARTEAEPAPVEES